MTRRDIPAAEYSSAFPSLPEGTDCSKLTVAPIDFEQVNAPGRSTVYPRTVCMGRHSVIPPHHRDLALFPTAGGTGAPVLCCSPRVPSTRPQRADELKLVVGTRLAKRPLYVCDNGPDLKKIRSSRTNVRRPLYILIPPNSEVSDEYYSTSGRLARHRHPSLYDPACADV